MTALPDLPIRHFRDATVWEKWLLQHGQTRGLWLKIAKKRTGVHSVSYQEALVVALCHGWIDGQRRACDETFFLQRFTPRRTRSLWSKANVEKVEKLIEEGKMHAAGLSEVERAKGDGRWHAAYGGARNMETPQELIAALAGDPKARAFFEKLDKTNRYAFCWRVQTAKRPETRTARAQKVCRDAPTGREAPRIGRRAAQWIHFFIAAERSAKSIHLLSLNSSRVSVSCVLGWSKPDGRRSSPMTSTQRSGKCTSITLAHPRNLSSATFTRSTRQAFRPRRSPRPPSRATTFRLPARAGDLFGKHSSAFWGFIRILRELGERRPPLVLLENVAGFLTSHGGGDLHAALRALNDQGYSVDAFTLDAARFVPQSRVRFFIVG